MIYNVDKEKFLKLLLGRPALIKKITGLDESVATECVEFCSNCYDFLPTNLKESVKVVRAYIKDNKYRLKMREIPKCTLKQLTVTERKNLIDWSSNGNFIKELPDPEYEEWLHAASCGFNTIEEIPEQYRGRKSLYMKMAEGLKSGFHDPDYTIPEKLWENETEGNKAAVEIVTLFDRMFKAIPKKHITNDILKATLQGELYLKRNDIPDSAWDQLTADLAVNANTSNIEYVPERFVTESMAIQAARNGVSIHKMISHIPDKEFTRTVLINIIAHSTTPFSENDTDYLPDEINSLDFQIEVAKENGLEGLTGIEDFIKPEYRTELLKICPEFIKIIPKLEQNDKIIDAFLSKATAEIIDDCANHINLGKIKKHHAPLLIGCTKNLILGVMEKKLRGCQRKKTTTPTEIIKTEKTTHTIEINVAPSDFAKIRDNLKDKNDV